MTRRFFIAILPALAAFLALGASPARPALAQGIERIDDFRDWSAFRYKENGETVCYMASQPKKSEGNYTKRGDVYAIITHRPSSDRVGEVSVNAGYMYKQDSTVQVIIGSRSWDLFTAGEHAWAPSAGDDQALIKAMKAGSGMVVKGTSARGTLTTDTFSLLGFSKAYAAISKACGM